MSMDIVFKCSQCGREKQKTNRWWMVTPTTLFVAATGGQRRGTLRILSFMPWDDAKAVLPEFRHICGEVCAHKELAQFMEKNGSIPAPPEKG